MRNEMHRSTPIAHFLPKRTRVHARKIMSSTTDRRMEGWLMKQGRVFRGFRRRFMRLEGHQISYRADSFEQPARGVIDLRGAFCKTRQEFGDDCPPVNWDSAPPECCFVIVTSSRTWPLLADTPDDVRNWISRIEAFIDTMNNLVITQNWSVIIMSSWFNGYFVEYETMARQMSTGTVVVSSHRYSSLLSMHEEIVGLFPDQMSGLLFPPKRIFGNYSQDVIDERRMQLNCYLQAITAIPCVLASTPVRKALRLQERDAPALPSEIMSQTAGTPIKEEDEFVLEVDETPDGLLGSGALGVVRRGVMRTVGCKPRPVAVKAYPTGMNHAATQREFELLHRAGTYCTHTVRTFGALMRNDRLCIVMELYPETLAQMVQREGQIPPMRALHLTRDLFVTIAELHEHGIVSRDIKASNVMLDKHGSMFLADFGISVQLLQTMGLHRPTDGGVQGTCDHLGPEGFTPDVFGGVGPPLDVWAGACVAQLLFTGREPFPGLNMFQTYQQVVHARQSPIVPSNLLPDPVATLLGRCCSYEPRDRPAAAQMVRELNALLGVWMAAWQLQVEEV